MSSLGPFVFAQTHGFNDLQLAQSAKQLVERIELTLKGGLHSGCDNSEKVVPTSELFEQP